MIDLRNSISKTEERLYKIQSLIGKFSLKSGGGVTLCELLNNIGVESNAISYLKPEHLHTKIVGICRSGSRLMKNCIVCQLYEDGPGVMRWAYKNGAILLVAKEQIDELPCLVTDDPAEVYAKLCVYYRKCFSIETTAVVGSIGKTTTKRMISEVYSTQFSVFCDPENENQLDCVGYISQHIPKKCNKLIQEVSEDTQGCVSKISRIIRPQIAVITEIDRSHIEAFGNEEGIYQEICSIVDGMDSGTLVMKAELWHDIFHKKFSKYKIMTVSIDDTDANIYARDISIADDGLRFNVVEKEKNESIGVFLKNVFAKHNVISALYAYAAGIAAGVNKENIIRGLESYRAVGIRQNIFKVNDNVTVYADCYNAVGKSIKSAIDAAALIPISGKRIAVIGDVEECGELSEETHREILESVNRSSFDLLFVYGPQLNREALKFEGRDTLNIICCKDRATLNTEIKQIIRSNDLILFKASRKSALEETIQYLWPKEYKKQRRNYIIPIVKWRIKTILN